jgi:cell division septum initiation protein DivIVA
MDDKRRAGSGRGAQDEGSDASIVPGLDRRTPAQEAAPRFDVVLRGYERGQVDAYVDDASIALRELRDALARARAEVDAARADAQGLRSELERGRPPAERVANRVGEILALAEAEAEQLREETRRRALEVEAEREQLLADARRKAQAMLDTVRRDAQVVSEQTRRQVEAAERRHAEIVASLARAHEQLAETLREARALPPRPVEAQDAETTTMIELPVEARPGGSADQRRPRH